MLVLIRVFLNRSLSVSYPYRIASQETGEPLSDRLFDTVSVILSRLVVISVILAFRHILNIIVKMQNV